MIGDIDKLEIVNPQKEIAKKKEKALSTFNKSASIRAKNEAYASEKITWMVDALDKFQLDAEMAEDQDESMFVFCYYRKWNWISTAWLQCYTKWNNHPFDNAILQKYMLDWVSSRWSFTNVDTEDDEEDEEEEYD